MVLGFAGKLSRACFGAWVVHGVVAWVHGGGDVCATWNIEQKRLQQGVNFI